MSFYVKARGLVDRVNINDAAVLNGTRRRLAAFLLIGDDADGDSAEPAVAAHHRLAVFRLVLVERGVIENARQQIAGIVFLARVGLEERVDVSGRVSDPSAGR